MDNILTTLMLILYIAAITFTLAIRFLPRFRLPCFILAGLSICGWLLCALVLEADYNQLITGILLLLVLSLWHPGRKGEAS